MQAINPTKLRVLEIGVRLWRAGEAVTSRRIARELGLTHGAINYHFRAATSDHSLRDAIAHYAVQQGDERVIAALILERHKAAAHLTDAQRREYLAAVI